MVHIVAFLLLSTCYYCVVSGPGLWKQAKWDLGHDISTPREPRRHSSQGTLWGGVSPPLWDAIPRTVCLLIWRYTASVKSLNPGCHLLIKFELTFHLQKSLMLHLSSCIVVLTHIACLNGSMQLVNVPV